jgi:hypothetical protein
MKPFKLERSKELYRNAYPNFIAIYWAYCRERLKDGVPLLSEYEEMDLQTRLLTTSNLDITLEEALAKTLNRLVVEFEFLVTGAGNVFGGYERTEYISTELEAKYTNFLRSPVVTQTVDLVSRYLQEHHGKKVRDENRHSSPGRDYADWTSESFEMLDIGQTSGGEITTWASLLKHGLGDSVDMVRFVKLAATVDLFRVGTFFQKIGMDHTHLMKGRNIELLDPNLRRLIDTSNIEEFRTEKTIGCPALIPPATDIQEHIKTYFPTLDPSETMIDGLCREVPLAISEELRKLREKEGRDAYELMLNRQEPILRGLLMEGRLKKDNFIPERIR